MTAQEGASRPSADIVIEKDAVITIRLPGLTGIRVDTAAWVIAIDGLSGTSPEPVYPEYAVRDLRDGIYGDFHRLSPADDCPDPADCAAIGQHDAAAAGMAGDDLAARLAAVEDEDEMDAAAADAAIAEPGASIPLADLIAEVTSALDSAMTASARLAEIHSIADRTLGSETADRQLALEAIARVVAEGAS